MRATASATASFYAAYLYPLSSLTELQLTSEMRQVVVRSFGSSFSSGELTYQPR